MLWIEVCTSGRSFRNYQYTFSFSLSLFFQDVSSWDDLASRPGFGSRCPDCTRRTRTTGRMCSPGATATWTCSSATITRGRTRTPSTRPPCAETCPRRPRRPRAVPRRLRQPPHPRRCRLDRLSVRRRRPGRPRRDSMPQRRSAFSPHHAVKEQRSARTV